MICAAWYSCVSSAGWQYRTGEIGSQYVHDAWTAAFLGTCHDVSRCARTVIPTESVGSSVSRGKADPSHPCGSRRCSARPQERVA